jgi:hypothetical protein
MSKTNRYTIHNAITPACRARLRELKEDYIQLKKDNANRQRILDEARARDVEWSEYIQSVRPLRQGKLFR